MDVPHVLDVVAGLPQPHRDHARQRPPSAKGHVFLTLEDEEGLVNLIVRPKVYERYRDALHQAPLLLVEGRLQQVERATSVLVYRAVPLAGGSRY